MTKPKDKDDKSLAESVRDKFKDFDVNEQMRGVRTFATNNTRDAVAYTILLVGLLISFFTPYLGQPIVGVIVGIYFSDAILNFFNNFNRFIHFLGVFKIFILAGASLVLLVSAPWFFIGLAAGIGLKTLILGEKNP